MASQSHHSGDKYSGLLDKLGISLMSNQTGGSSSQFRFKVPGARAIKALQNKFKETDALLTKPHHNAEAPVENNCCKARHDKATEPEGNNEESIEVISVSHSVEEEEPNPITHLVFGFWGDFFDFLMVTDVFSLGVGIIIGTIFTDVINSFVTDILTPPIGLLLGNAQLQNLFFVIKEGNTKKKEYETVKQALDDGAVTINFGIFLQALLRFLLVTLILFWCIQAFQILKKEQEKLDLPSKISESAHKVSKLVETIAGGSPKSDTKPLDTPQSPTLKQEESHSPEPSDIHPLKEEKQTGLLDFVGPSDFNPSSPKQHPATEKKFSCIFCYKPLNSNVIRCPYCTSILNPCRYQCAQEELKNSK